MNSLIFKSVAFLAFISLSSAVGDRLETSGSQSVYLRKSSNRDSSLYRDGLPRISKIYHYDNLTDCENACEVACGTTFVIRNDVDEKRQFSCTQRKLPMVSAFIDMNNSGTLMLVLAGALMACGLLVIICCCCLRFCGCCHCTGGCCRRGCYSPDNLSNDPLVNGEFRETLDSKDIGYLKKERVVVTV